MPIAPVVAAFLLVLSVALNLGAAAWAIDANYGLRISVNWLPTGRSRLKFRLLSAIPYGLGSFSNMALLSTMDSGRWADPVWGLVIAASVAVGIPPLLGWFAPLWWHNRRVRRAAAVPVNY